MKPDNIEVYGEVTQALPNTSFRVKLSSDAPEEFADKEILCILAGKMRIYRIRVMPGDKVKVEITPYDPNKGRIVYREKWKSKLVLKNVASTAKSFAAKERFMLFAKTLGTNNDRVNCQNY